MANPKHAMVALRKEEFVGGLAFKIFENNNSEMIGFIEAAFVSKKYAGEGIGSHLYQKTINHLKEKGCSKMITMVRDDNVASWKSFENNGFNKINFLNDKTAWC